MVSFRSHLVRSLSLTFTCWSLAGFLMPSVLRAADSSKVHPLVLQWLQSQTNLLTWRADVAQTRTLKSLTQPLQATGRVWFRAPNLFRWELGDPARTIALRQPDQMLVIYPRLKRAERYPLHDGQAGPWKETLALLETGFPRSQEDLLARFKLTDQSLSNDLFQLELQPRSASARRIMPRLTISFSTNDLVLRSTELTFTDGSTMRNVFLNPVVNPILEPTLFDSQLDPSYRILNPLAQ